MLYSLQSFRAYRKWVEVNGEEALLPGLNMTHEQVQANLSFLLKSHFFLFQKFAKTHACTARPNQNNQFHNLILQPPRNF